MTRGARPWLALLGPVLAGLVSGPRWDGARRTMAASDEDDEGDESDGGDGLNACVRMTVKREM